MLIRVVHLLKDGQKLSAFHILYEEPSKSCSVILPQNVDKLFFKDLIFREVLLRC